MKTKQLGFNLFELSIGICLLIIICVFGFLTVINLYINNECAKFGYPNAKITFDVKGLQYYCIRRIDQTDFIVPLNKVQNEKTN